MTCREAFCDLSILNFSAFTFRFEQSTHFFCEHVQLGESTVCTHLHIPAFGDKFAHPEMRTALARISPSLGIPAFACPHLYWYHSCWSQWCRGNGCHSTALKGSADAASSIQSQRVFKENMPACSFSQRLKRHGAVAFHTYQHHSTSSCSPTKTEPIARPGCGNQCRGQLTL